MKFDRFRNIINMAGKESFLFLTSRIFLLNIGIILTISLLLFWLFVQVIPANYSNHNEEISVPDLTQLSVTDAERMLKSRNLKLIVVDSIFKLNKKGGLILEQEPIAEAKVKPHRKIYLTISSFQAPEIPIYYKQFIGRPLANLRKSMKEQGVELSIIKEVPGKAQNTIAAVYWKQKLLFEELDPATGELPPTQAKMIKKGSRLDVVIYQSMDYGPQVVPELVCFPYEAARLKIVSNDFLIGKLHLDEGVFDTTQAVVYKQVPDVDSLVSRGAPIELWLQKASCD